MFTKSCIKSEGGGVVSFGSILLVDYECSGFGFFRFFLRTFLLHRGDALEGISGFTFHTYQVGRRKIGTKIYYSTLEKRTFLNIMRRNRMECEFVFYGRGKIKTFASFSCSMQSRLRHCY